MTAQPKGPISLLVTAETETGLLCVRGVDGLSHEPHGREGLEPSLHPRLCDEQEPDRARLL